MLKIKTESNSFPVLPIDTSAPLKLMKDRETLIFSGLKEVEEKKQEVEKEAESYRQKPKERGTLFRT
jgi:hypothetical protein